MKKSKLEKTKEYVRYLVDELSDLSLNPEKIEEGIQYLYANYGEGLPMLKIIYTKSPREMYEKAIELLCSCKEIGPLELKTDYVDLPVDSAGWMQYQITKSSKYKSRDKNKIHKGVGELKQYFKRESKKKSLVFHSFQLPRLVIYRDCIKQYGHLSKLIPFQGAAWMYTWTSLISFAYYKQYSDKFHQNINQIEMSHITSLIEKYINMKSIFDAIYFDKYVVLCGYPLYIKLNEEDQVHYDGGPTVEWEDGCKFWFLNGVQVSQELAETPSHKLDVDTFLKETTIDIKAQFLLKYGIERLVDRGKLIDSYKNYDKLNKEWEKSEYELYDMTAIMPVPSIEEGGIIRKALYLKMKNLSVNGIYHLEGVDSNCQNITDALKFRYGEDQEYETISIK